MAFILVLIGLVGLAIMFPPLWFVYLIVAGIALTAK